MKKIVVITGANSGIGKAAAVKFASEGYRVVMACRSLQSGEPARREILQKANADGHDVDLLQLDISSRQSIRSFFEAYRKEYDVLDILIHNAGHFKHGETGFQHSPDGMELTFATNVLGPVLLTHLLRDELAKSDDPRVLNACSTNIKHFFDNRRKIDFTTMSGLAVTGKKYDSYQLYGDSKMALLMETFAMAREYEHLGICVNAIMIPAAKMSKNTISKFGSYWRLLAVLQQPFVPKTEIIGDAYFSICASMRYKGITGKLINRRGQIVAAGGESVSFIQVMTGSDVYPLYAEDAETSRRVREICSRYTDTDERNPAE